jgi:tryptophan 2,3-dioxygenase
MELSAEIVDRIRLLKEKYDAMGQDLVSYLDGLLYADYLTYWDYIHLDTLLSLQNPRTPFPDEQIFIMYHQITELYFKLCLHELEQIAERDVDAAFIAARLERVNRYFINLTHSFEVMVGGMEQEQFLKYRMSLLPASGFQSAQYRMIEMYATDFRYLVDKDHRERLQTSNASLKEQFEHIYWKAGATELKSGKKTLTLKQFEAKYSIQLLELAQRKVLHNVYAKFRELEKRSEDLTVLKEKMRHFDVLVNVNWPLMHYKSAVRYLQRNPADIAATGGTNWQKYLPPRFQRRIFYPELWSEQEKEEWGKAWVEEVISQMNT